MAIFLIFITPDWDLVMEKKIRRVRAEIVSKSPLFIVIEIYRCDECERKCKSVTLSAILSWWPVRVMKLKTLSLTNEKIIGSLHVVSQTRAKFLCRCNTIDSDDMLLEALLNFSKLESWIRAMTRGNEKASCLFSADAVCVFGKYEISPKLIWVKVYLMKFCIQFSINNIQEH